MGGTSRISREAYVRFCERLGVKFPGATRRSEGDRRPYADQWALSVAIRTLPRGDKNIKRNAKTVEFPGTVVVEGGFHDSLPARKSFGVGEAQFAQPPMSATGVSRPSGLRSARLVLTPKIRSGTLSGL